MAINYDSILDTFILKVKEALPTELSLTGPLNDSPAVIRARQQEGIMPDPPYVVVDVLDTSQDGWLVERYLNDSEEMVYDTNKFLLLNFIVYGGNAISIANKLHGYFRLSRVLEDIRNTLDGQVVENSNITSTPLKLSDKYLESASFTMTFAVVDTFVDTTGTDVFDTVDLSGELYRHKDDNNPLDINVVVP